METEARWTVERLRRGIGLGFGNQNQKFPQ